MTEVTGGYQMRLENKRFRSILKDNRIFENNLEVINSATDFKLNTDQMEENKLESRFLVVCVMQFVPKRRKMRAAATTRTMTTFWLR
jgi:hypothetical protein